jgi:hypothetical protein
MAQLMDGAKARGRGSPWRRAVPEVERGLVAGMAAERILDAAPANILVADPGLSIVYINPRAMQTLRRLGPEIQRAFGVRVEDVLGGSIHRFHKDPARIERILNDPAFQPRDAQFTFGSVTLDGHINRITAPGGDVIGYVVTLDDVSDMVAARTRGDMMTQRLGETVGRTKDVSASLQSVATAMEQMSATVNEIARNGTEAAGVVTAAVAGVETATTTMNRLGGASEQINEVVNTISIIARQTNLLALNATIEAARAGTAGKGFAVVAGEVKDLSAATQAATERIGELIGNVQTLSRLAGEEIAKIAGIVESVRDSQGAVAAAVEEQTVTNHEIARNLAVAAQQAQTVTVEVATFLENNG